MHGTPCDRPARAGGHDASAGGTPVRNQPVRALRPIYCGSLSSDRRAQVWPHPLILQASERALHSWRRAFEPYPQVLSDRWSGRCARGARVSKNRTLTCSAACIQQISKGRMRTTPLRDACDCRLLFMPSLMKICRDLLGFTHGFRLRGVAIEKRQDRPTAVFTTGSLGPGKDCP